MRIIITLVLLMAVLLAWFGYEREWFSFSTNSDDESSRVTVNVNKGQWRIDRDEFHKQAEARLADMQKKLDEMRARAAKADSSIRTVLDKEIAEMQRKCQAAREELKGLDNVTQEKWESARSKLGQAIDDLKTGFANAEARFR